MVKRHLRGRQRRIEIHRRLHLEQLGDRRVLAAITGAVFEDLNRSLQRDAGEPDAAARLVYLDINANASLDAGEPLTLTQANGSFSFNGLADGTYRVRLFNGTDSQIQTFPIEAETSTAITISGGHQLIAGDSFPLSLTTDSVVRTDLMSGTTSIIDVGDQLTGSQRLPDGRLLVIGGDESGDASWIVDPVSESVEAIDLTEGSPASIAWSQLALDGSGRGVLLPVAQSGGPSMVTVRSIDTLVSTGDVEVTTTSTMVPSDTQVLSSATGVRSVFASSTGGGLSLFLWSNTTASPIPQTSADVLGTSELVAFDDASGLVALRNIGGGISVYDVDANFAPLYSIDGDVGPVVIDAARDLLITYSPLDAALKLVNLHDATLVADLAIDLSSIGQVAALAKGGTADSIVVLGSAGIHEIKLSRPAAHRVNISGGQDVDSLLFGLALNGANAAPRYDQLPLIETDEDESLSLAAPATRVGSLDDDDDSYVLLQRGPALHGTATLGINGSLTYTPDANFNGTDSITVILHDGRDASAEIILSINVAAVPDSPTGITINIDPVPEDLQPGMPIGIIEVIDVDGGGHAIEIDDPRFDEQGGQIIFIGGPLNFEAEPLIPINVDATDTQTGETVSKSVSVSITNANDPITGILPTSAFVFENAPGDVITELQVIDEDEDQFYSFTVDDKRFIVEEFDLRLADGVSVDYETEQTIVVHVTAIELGGTTGAYTETITIIVRDLPEQPTSLTLTKRTVMEFKLADVAGEVLIDGAPPNSNYDLSVDDNRFEIAGSTLKLKDDEFVERAVQSEIQVMITAEDPSGELATIERTFVIEVLGNESPLHNQDDPFDVNHGDGVTASDALAIINYLNTYGPGPVGSGAVGYCYDVNADGFVTALDALLVLNQLNKQPSGTVGGEGEGGQAPTPVPAPKSIISGEQIATKFAAPAEPSGSVGAKTRDAFFVQWQSVRQTVAAFAMDSLDDTTSSSPDIVDQSLKLLSEDNA